MTPTDINAIVEKHLDAWFSDGPWTPGCPQIPLRERVADAIREALALRDRHWQAGQAGLRTELQQAQDEIDRLRKERHRYEGLLTKLTDAATKFTVGCN